MQEQVVFTQGIREALLREQEAYEAVGYYGEEEKAALALDVPVDLVTKRANKFQTRHCLKDPYHIMYSSMGYYTKKQIKLFEKKAFDAVQICGGDFKEAAAIMGIREFLVKLRFEVYRDGLPKRKKPRKTEDRAILKQNTEIRRRIAKNKIIDMFSMGGYYWAFVGVFFFFWLILLAGSMW